jgi:hypothetical protein
LNGTFGRNLLEGEGEESLKGGDFTEWEVMMMMIMMMMIFT